MIVDCYTCIWNTPGRGGRAASNGRNVFDGGREEALRGDVDNHFSAAKPVDWTVVVGFTGRFLEPSIPNDTVAEYVSRHADRMIGFAGIDPTHPKEAVAELERAKSELGMRGAAISPAAQNFHPCHTDAKTCYEAAQALGLPVLFHTGVRLAPESVLAYARPVLLDEVSREFPGLHIIIAHMGFPWVTETVALLGKHANVYCDISGLLQQPWQAYQSLLTAFEFGVMDKVLFGSGFPYAKPAACIESLYGINHLVQGSAMPMIPREQLRGIVERNSLDLLGIEVPTAAAKTGDAPSLIDEDD